MSVLVTGAASGIGRYLADWFGADIITRAHPLEMLGILVEPYDLIVHCAFDMRRDVGLDQLQDYLSNTIALTERVARVPHRAFVLLSSIDVYPAGDGMFDEQTEINAFMPRNLYALCKMSSESSVMRLATNPLILRAGLLLGPYMRSNNLTRLIRGEALPLTLTGGSSFHCVGYADIAAIIEHATKAKLTGTYNAAFCPAVTMEEIADRFGREPVFGEFEYRTPAVSNDRLRKACPHFIGTSMSAVESYAASLGILPPTRNPYGPGADA